ncbi:MAG: hypothetical protein IOD03_13610 [Methylocystis sp.]|nr:hypothetical protein [Methylocystis sp.]MCA3593350.1 hypothetical protein [Methylocystis sp.]
MTDESTQEKQTFTIILPESAVCDEAAKALGERYLGAAGGDPVLGMLLACQDVMWLRDCASHGLTRGRKLTIDQD